MPRHAVLALALIFTVGAAAAANATAASELLERLSSELSAIRASSGADRVTLTSVPDVHPLKGSSRQQLVASLGNPDNCVQSADAQCMALPSWTYSFVYLPQGWRGGGPSLHLAFGPQGVVRNAQWQFSR